MPAKPFIVLVCKDLSRLSEISSMLDPQQYAYLLAQTYNPLEYMLGSFQTRPLAAVIDMTGNEMIVEFHESLEQSPGTKFVFRIPEMPPAASVARVVADQGLFLSKGESPLTVCATVVSLLKQASGA